MAEEKLSSYLVYESWIAAGKMLDKDTWHDLRDRIDDYGIYGVKNFDGLSSENIQFLKTVFIQIDKNKKRYEKAVEAGERSPGAPPKSDYLEERGMLEFGLSGAEIGRYYGVQGNAITQGAIYQQWKNEGRPTPNKPKGKNGRLTVDDYFKWKDEKVNNQELIIDENNYVDENGHWNF